MSAAIELLNFTKDYGSGRGVFDVSFEVVRGEVFGFLGPNGAGKTVTMRNLMGFVQPDSGTVSIGGMNCFSQRAEIQQSLGYLPGEIACMDEMSGIRFLEFMARMKNMHDRARMHELIEYFELDPGRKIRKMSKGTKQKIGLVCAFMTSPDILLLDEPTSGLDPLMQNRFIELVLAEKARGATIVLSSHLFEEVERTCDRVAFIRAGKITAVESMDSVRSSRKRVFGITFCDKANRDRYVSEHRGAVMFEGIGESELLGLQAGSKRGTTNLREAHALQGLSLRSGLSVEVAVSGGVDAFVKDLGSYEIFDLAAREQSLEELFLHLYGVEGEGDDHE